ncbi:cytochrome P450 [Dacryopinax primogenitus]|uniref:Cytochrome P450 n=1 Tax=Dacryopinax primogenitus (strain DJM 731) TaxID=1858805 RepID=M5G594_DACPD|nr:cytochrome P450 [Dacryopinax primogenitus]EJT98927.1 cytochrome P450 [Dacryopinax primogenitus]
MLYSGLILVVALVFAVGIRDAYRKRISQLLPGPPGLPILGNLLQLPSQFLYRKLTSWSEQYGPFYTFWMMNQPFVVVGNTEIAADLLDRMSAMTSNRPRMIKAREFYMRDMAVVLQDRSHVWRAQRRAMHANINVKTASRFNSMQSHDAAYLALGLLQHLETPLYEDTHRFASSIIFCSLYGGNAIPLDGPDPSKEAEELTDQGLHVTIPQHSVVDTMPFLEPLIKRNWDATTIVQDLQQNNEKYELERSQAMWMTMIMFMAGQETTNTALRAFTLAMRIRDDNYTYGRKRRVSPWVKIAMSAVTSDRPRMIKAREFYTKDMSLVLQDRSPKWRAQRRAIHANINIRATSRFNPMQTHDAAYLTLGLLQHPEKPFHEHAHRFAASIIFGSLYGGREIPIDGPDPSQTVEELTDRGLHFSMPQHSLVDALPFLKPLIMRVKWFRRPADIWFADSVREATLLYDSAKATDNWDATTIVHDLRLNNEKYELEKAQGIWMTMVLFMAGQETTNTVLRVFTLAMLHHPDVVQAAQRQLDAVCGGRVPGFEDRDNLPYIQAIVKEALRWRPAVPLSVPHRATEDFEYRGYIVPKGTIILDNLWGQTQDPMVYAEPETFKPARFLDSSGNLRPVTPDTRLDQLGFGHGRRACAGRNFAFNSLFIACAYMLWAFDFKWPLDKNGNEIICGVHDLEDKGIVITPKPFGVVLKPRKDGLENRLLAALGQ